MSTENYYEKGKLQHTYLEMKTLSNIADGKPAKEAENNKLAETFFRRNPLVANVLGLCDVGASGNVRPTNNKKPNLKNKCTIL